MNEEKEVLPKDFNGVFYFTNSTKDEFKGIWGKVEYIFPPESTTPMSMPFTPMEIQNIRKKFAKDLAIQEFYKTKKFKKMDDVPPGGTPGTYTDSDLTEFIQKCLEPLPPGRITTKVLPKDSEGRYTKDRKGRPVTRVLDGDESLMKEGSAAIE